MVLEASARKIVAQRADGESIEITGEGLRAAQSGLSDKAPERIKIRRGAVIRVMKTPKGGWEITQLPEVEGAFVAIDSKQAPSVRWWVALILRKQIQPRHASVASTWLNFKPFIYSAALEKRFTPATVVNDAPLFSALTSQAASLGSLKITTASSRGLCLCAAAW